jgi:hypothetical protein
MDFEKSTQPPSQKVLYHNYFNSCRFKQKTWGAESSATDSSVSLLQELLKDVGFFW